MTAARTVVVAVGGPHGDDAVGHLVADRLGDAAVVRVAGGDPAALLEAWTGAQLAVVVDAVRSGAPPGTLHRLDGHVAAGARSAAWSSHGPGVGAAIALADALGRLPARIVVIGIEIADITPGAPVSAAVRAAVPRAAHAIRGELAAAG